MGVGAMFSFLDKLISKLPIQDRKERWKNKIDKLKTEKRKILRGECNEKESRRITAISIRINKLERLFRNVA